MKNKSYIRIKCAPCPWVFCSV